MDGSYREQGWPWAMLWPGLYRAWYHGSMLGLLAACLQTALLNVLLISSFLWTALLEPQVRWGMWCLCGTFWLVGLVEGRYAIVRHRIAREQDPQLDLFLAVRGEYLRGEWTQAAERLQQMLRSDPRDVEARLAIATLMRHCGEGDEAREHLRKLQRLERAGHWNLEIEREWQQLAWQSVVAEQDASERSGPRSGGCHALQGRLESFLAFESLKPETGRRPTYRPTPLA